MCRNQSDKNQEGSESSCGSVTPFPHQHWTFCMCTTCRCVIISLAAFLCRSVAWRDTERLRGRLGMYRSAGDSVDCNTQRANELNPPIDLPAALEGDVINETRYRRTYDSEFSATTIEYFVWPALIRNGKVICKGEVVTKRLPSPRTRKVCFCISR